MPLLAQHQLVVPRTVPWFAVGDAQAADHVIVHLHGLGERARPVAEALRPGVPDGALLAVPEALSRYLPRPLAPKAAACWSTGEDAEADLADNVGYLDRLRSALDEAVRPTRWSLVGFSQGGLTALRWLAASRHRWDRVVLWASAPPRDVAPEALQAGLGDAEVVVVLGDADPFARHEQVQAARARLDTLAPGWRSVAFPGAHEVPAPVFREVLT